MTYSENEEPPRAQRRRTYAAQKSIMSVFRDAHAVGTSSPAGAPAPPHGQEATRRDRLRREGIDEQVLRDHLRRDLDGLLNTINLESAVPLDDYPEVRRSVVNYGFRDLSNVAASELGSAKVIRSVREALLNHEPRIVAESVQIRVLSEPGDVNRPLRLHVSADLISDPVEISLEFEADIDLGAGKLQMSDLRMGV